MNFLSGYVDEIEKLMFTLSVADLNTKLQEYKAHVPEPMNTMFPERLGKEEAIKNKEIRKMASTHLFPAGKQSNIQHVLHIQ